MTIQVHNPGNWDEVWHSPALVPTSGAGPRRVRRPRGRPNRFSFLFSCDLIPSRRAGSLFGASNCVRPPREQTKAGHEPPATPSTGLDIQEAQQRSNAQTSTHCRDRENMALSSQSEQSIALPSPPLSTNAYSSLTSASVARLDMGDGCNRPDSNSGAIAASNLEDSVTVSARESTP
jgi:hypothetical protein